MLNKASRLGNVGQKNPFMPTTVSGGTVTSTFASGDAAGVTNEGGAFSTSSGFISIAENGTNGQGAAQFFVLPSDYFSNINYASELSWNLSMNRTATDFGQGDLILTDSLGNQIGVDLSTLPSSTGTDFFIDVSTADWRSINASAYTTGASLTEAQVKDFLTDVTGIKLLTDYFVGNETTDLNSLSMVICFASGTLIKTANGDIPVEALRKDDLVVCQDGISRKVRWIGRRVLNEIDLAINPDLKPIKFLTGSMGAGLPERNLSLSPQQKILVNNEVSKKNVWLQAYTCASKMFCRARGHCSRRQRCQRHVSPHPARRAPGDRSKWISV